MSTIETLRLVVDQNAIGSAASQSALRHAAEILRAGGTVAFPTETVYGLGANALDASAVKRIFEAKGRPSWDPLIVHVANDRQLAQVTADLPGNARALMQTFWPGPLTLLLPKNSELPEAVTAGRPKVGVRMPRHPVALALIELAQAPIAAPSANSFGRTSPTRAEFVLEDLSGRIDAVIDSGATSLGLESTVLDICEDPPVLYRPGMVTFDQLKPYLSALAVYRSPINAEQAPEAQASPGMGLRHYAPRARLLLLAGMEETAEMVQKLQRKGETVGVMQLAEAPQLPRETLIYEWGKWTDAGQLGRRLFSGLRELDAAGATVILCPLPADEGIGVVIRDRLFKAARGA